MYETVINKINGAKANLPNLLNYQSSFENFDWAQARKLVKGYQGGINMAYEAVDRHVEEGYGCQLALVCLDKNQQRREYTYQQLSVMSNQFSNLLQALGVQPGEVLCSVSERVPMLFTVILGTLKAGVVFCPLFSAFGPEPIRARMDIAKARVLVTSARLYAKKIAAWRHQLPSLKWVLLYDCEPVCTDDCINLDQALNQQEHSPKLVPTSAEDKALLHFTSGTTGQPKGVVHVHDAVVHHKYSGYCALDMQPEDVYWCTADPGWVTGISYGVISPLCNRLTLIVDNQDFDAQRWYHILEQEKVNIWYTAPTAIRMLIKAGDDMPGNYDLSALRFMASVGEPLNPEAVVWSQKVLGNIFHDNWWQTETGGIMLANFAAEKVKPGSMGRPLPGIEAGIVSRDKSSGSLGLLGPGEIGELALRLGWPSMFRDYLHETVRYQACFEDNWYLSGDLAYCDEEGYYWFVGRNSDLIKSAGHLIGPFEVESALMEHPAVAEAAVIGIPDPVAGEVVKAYVALKPAYAESPELLKQLMAHVRLRLGAALAPREISIRANLPKTRSGKIMRRLLKARELGLPEGDLSTLESDDENVGKELKHDS